MRFEDFLCPLWFIILQPDEWKFLAPGHSYGIPSTFPTHHPNSTIS